MMQTKLACLLMAVAVMAASPLAHGQTTQPTTLPSNAVTIAEFQLRANQAMARGDYAAALPLLQKVEQQLTDQPDQLGPVMEQIRVCRRQIATGNKSPIAATPVVPAGEARKPHAAPADGTTVELAIKDLGNFDFDAEKGGDIPDDVKKLEGCRFRTHGFMIPLDQAESISEFALVPSLFACCFGQPPQIQHTIIVHCPKGKALSYFQDEISVEGTLHVRENRDGGFIVSIFEIDAASIHPAAQ